MKRTIIITTLIILSLALIAWVGWARKAGIAAQILEKHLGVPVSLQSLELTRQGGTLSNLVVRNPRGYRSPSAFTAETIAVDTTWKQLRSNPLTIDRIEMSNLLITIEESRSGPTNWDKILGNAPPKSSSHRHWLIKALILNNLSVQVVQANGQIKQYPTLARMEFYNLTDETGFPVDAIEKAIFNEVMKNLLRNFNLQKLLNPVMPQGILPSLPSLF